MRPISALGGSPNDQGREEGAARSSQGPRDATNGNSPADRLWLWIGGAVITVVALAAVIAFFISSPVVEELTKDAAEKDPAQVGSACSPLLAALENFENQADAEGTSAIKEARRNAVQSLQKGNDKFGRPEELALRLGADLATPPLRNRERQEIVHQLESIIGTCAELKG